MTLKLTPHSQGELRTVRKQLLTVCTYNDGPEQDASVNQMWFRGHTSSNYSSSIGTYPTVFSLDTVCFCDSKLHEDHRHFLYSSRPHTYVATWVFVIRKKVRIFWWLTEICDQRIHKVKLPSTFCYFTTTNKKLHRLIQKHGWLCMIPLKRQITKWCRWNCQTVTIVIPHQLFSATEIRNLPLHLTFIHTVFHRVNERRHGLRRPILESFFFDLSPPNAAFWMSFSMVYLDKRTLKVNHLDQWISVFVIQARRQTGSVNTSI